jgi:hypothetical protein
VTPTPTRLGKDVIGPNERTPVLRMVCCTPIAEIEHDRIQASHVDLLGVPASVEVVRHYV